MIAVDLLAWTQTLLLHGDLARAEPKNLRYRLLHAAARLTRGARRTPAPHRPALALGSRPRHRVHPTRRTTRPGHLTHHTRPDEHPGEPGTAQAGRTTMTGTGQSRTTTRRDSAINHMNDRG